MRHRVSEFNCGRRGLASRHEWLIIWEKKPGCRVARGHPGRMGDMGTAGNEGFRRGAFRQG